MDYHVVWCRNSVFLKLNDPLSFYLAPSLGQNLNLYKYFDRPDFVQPAQTQ